MTSNIEHRAAVQRITDAAPRCFNFFLEVTNREEQEPGQFLVRLATLFGEHDVELLDRRHLVVRLVGDASDELA